MKLTLGFSPCPNDTFIFDALVNGKIDTNGYTFETYLEDVETLNQWALQGKLNITKMSFAASCGLQQQFSLLPTGAALGKGVGPLLISKNVVATQQQQPITIALPGQLTTAHFLYNYYGKMQGQKIYLPFNQIEDWVLAQPTNQIRLGVIIHENRFTYQQKGLQLVQDLGTYWEQQTSLPIPLGGIFMQKHFTQTIQNDINQLLQQSLQYAITNYSTTLPQFVTTNAQEMSESIMRQHINLYVNNYSLQLGVDGNKAIAIMQKMLA